MKWYSYVICVILIAVGTFFGIRLYQKATSESYINGSIDITNEFYKESFSYGSTAVPFYPSENAENYEWNNELLKVDFDGEEKEYIVKLNDYILLAEVSAGKVTADVRMDFYDTDGNIVCNGAMSLKIEFFSDRTELTLVCPDENSANYFEQYFSDNGIKLTVSEVL